jgi:hypothetical protein
MQISGELSPRGQLFTFEPLTDRWSNLYPAEAKGREPC